MKQLPLLPTKKTRKEHGGSLLLGKRRNKRPLCLKSPHHIILRSDFAYGRRSLLRHRPLIHRVITKAKKRFDIKVYEVGIASNHIHLGARGKSRSNLQNFFRVLAGHIAQEILREFPILPSERSRGGAPHAPSTGKKTREKENKFWQTRLYTRIVSWGREWIAVKKYIIQNGLEALGLIPYRERKPRRDSS
jgi:REP element-mobilizing transposase RayT